MFLYSCILILAPCTLAPPCHLDSSILILPSCTFQLSPFSIQLSPFSLHLIRPLLKDMFHFSGIFLELQLTGQNEFIFFQWTYYCIPFFPGYIHHGSKRVVIILFPGFTNGTSQLFFDVDAFFKYFKNGLMIICQRFLEDHFIGSNGLPYLVNEILISFGLVKFMHCFPGIDGAGFDVLDQSLNGLVWN